MSDDVAVRVTELPCITALAAGAVNAIVGTVISTTLTVGEDAIFVNVPESRVFDFVVKVLVSGDDGATALLAPPLAPYRTVIVSPLLRVIAVTRISRPTNVGTKDVLAPIEKLSAYTVAPGTPEAL